MDIVQGTGDTLFGAIKGMGWLMGSTQSGWDELADGTKIRAKMREDGKLE